MKSSHSKYNFFSFSKKRYNLFKSISAYVLICFKVFLTSFVHLVAQEVPQEFYEFKLNDLKYDFDDNWKRITNFGPFRFQDIDEFTLPSEDSLVIKTRYGIQSINENATFYGYGNLRYSKYFYGYIYSRIVSNASSFPRYSGIPREVERAGFNSGEVDLGGIGFQNTWATIQIGRGRISSASGNKIELALSNGSVPYDYGLIDLDFGTLRMRYANGFLESDSSFVNRYITFRGVEWSNLSSFVISLSEAVIYSGINRPIDFAYLNPMSTHLEIELNNRQNQLGTESGNGVWQLSIDWKAKPSVRVSGNLLFDEFVLDEEEKNLGKDHGIGYSGRVNINLLKNEKYTLSTYLHIIKINKPVLRHGDGNNNFVIRNKPLGWEFGSDGKELELGFNYIYFDYLIGSIHIGERLIGEESIINRSYEPYKNYFNEISSSGEIDKIIFFKSEVQYWWRENISFKSGIEWYDSSLNNDNFQFNFGIDIYFSIKSKII